MRVSRLNTSLLLSLLLLLFSTSVTAQTADDEEPDDYDVKARVARISLISGQVNLKRSGEQEWEPVRLNYPLVEGDTIATDKDSRIEIQIDARNFVRLMPNSVLRIVTLRDEGIAIGVVEGTATVRLAKFDRDKEYFEIDAPRSTMAAEKAGFYRVDAPREGRVRMTVREGGSARIYSDTSGFALRDSRSAELVVTGDTAGDWEFFVAAAPDAVDAWVSDRERFLAQRLKYDTKYYDEYVWGAEDLDAYGDWNYSNDFGWVWRPHGSVINAYHDWAPYRYGHWTWVSPYGWTWVGYEPWGWAPYHYGRWVYHNNHWVWVPRSKFHKNRSWWRPALVAFVGFNFSFGDNICWYPLSYYQRDPHSRHYRHDNRRYDRDRDRRYGDGNDRHRRYDDPDKHWRGVTRVPRRDFGNRERRGEAAEENVARRVIDSEPQRGGDLPRGGFARTVPEQGGGRQGRISPVIDIPDRTTGAGERAPGVSMDEDLRRGRVYRGRDPRPNPPPTQTTTTAPATTTTPGTTTTPATTQPAPTGAVARPEPRTDSPGRIVRPRMPDDVEKRERGQQQIGTTPRNTPAEPRTTNPPAPAAEPAPAAPREETPNRGENRERENRERETPISRPEPRRETQPEPRVEPRNEPRSESPRPAPAPRSEPRSEPRQEQRSEPRSQPRSEPSRSESPRNEAPRSESPRSEAPRSDPPRSDPPRSDPPRSESPRAESPRSEAPRPGKPDNPMH